MEYLTRKQKQEILDLVRDLRKHRGRQIDYDNTMRIAGIYDALSIMGYTLVSDLDGINFKIITITQYRKNIARGYQQS